MPVAVFGVSPRCYVVSPSSESNSDSVASGRKSSDQLGATVQSTSESNSLWRFFAASVAASVIVSLIGAVSPAFAAPVEPLLRVVAGTGTAGLPIPGPALASNFNNPTGIAVDAAGNIYVADYENNVVEKITPAGVLSIVAGNGTRGVPTPGPATNSALNRPSGVAVDGSGNIYISDGSNNVIEKVDNAGTLSVIAGQPGNCGTPVPGPATATELCNTGGLTVDKSGNIFVAAYGNNLVVKITPAGVLSVIAGTGDGGLPTPGRATSSKLNQPNGVAVGSAGEVYIADSANCMVEKVTAAGVLSVVAGTGTFGVPSPGPATSSNLAFPMGVALDSRGNLYISDMFNQRIEKLAPSGDLSVIAGSGSAGAPVAGPAALSGLYNPVGLAVNAQGYVYVADFWNHVVEEISEIAPTAPPSDVQVTSSGSSSTISWSAPTYLGGSPITGYTVTASPGGASCVSVTTSCTIAGLSDGVNYSFVVTAANGVGTSDPSTPATAGTLASTGANLEDLLWVSMGLVTTGSIMLTVLRRRSTIVRM